MLLFRVAKQAEAKAGEADLELPAASAPRRGFAAPRAVGRRGVDRDLEQLECAGVVALLLEQRRLLTVRTDEMRTSVIRQRLDCGVVHLVGPLVLGELKPDVA